MNKKFKALKERYEWSLYRYGTRDIYDVYHKPSPAKIEAYNKIARECYAKSGYCLTVVNGNCHQFSMAYRYKDIDKKEVIVYHTKCNKYVIKLY